MLISTEAIRDARATTAKQFEEDYKRLTSANQKLEQQIKGVKTDEKSEGLMSMVSQVIRRSPAPSAVQQSPSQATLPEGKSSDLGNTLSQVITTTTTM